MADDFEQSWFFHLLPAFTAAALLLLCYALLPEQGWAMVVVGAALIAFLVALKVERQGRRQAGDLLIADRRAAIWLTLPFAAFGAWAFGIGVSALYATLSFFWVQRHQHSRRPYRQD